MRGRGLGIATLLIVLVLGFMVDVDTGRAGGPAPTPPVEGSVAGGAHERDPAIDVTVQAATDADELLGTAERSAIPFWVRYWATSPTLSPSSPRKGQRPPSLPRSFRDDL